MCSSTTTSPDSASVPTLFVLYGSATGNAEDIAKSLAQQARTNPDSLWYNCNEDQVFCGEGNQFKKQCLPTWEASADDTSTNGGMTNVVLVVTSTTGNGDAPENISRFVRYLKRTKSPTTLFQKSLCAVLALGDTNYDQFCACGILVDRKLRDLGATMVQPLVCADEGTGNLEGVVDPWTADIWKTLQQHLVSGQKADDETEQQVANGEKDQELEPAPEPSHSKASSSETAESSSKDPSTLGWGVACWQAQVQQTSLPPNDDDFQSWRNKTASTNPPTAPVTYCTLLDATTSHLPVISTPSQVSDDNDDEDEEYYSASRPFASTLCAARYLTLQTSTEAAQQVATEENAPATVHSLDDVVPVPRVREIYNQHFDLENAALSEQHGKRVLELTLSLPSKEDQWKFQPGDSLGLLVPNFAKDVDWMMQQLQTLASITDASSVALSKQAPAQPFFRGTLRQALLWHVDLSSPQPLQSTRVWKRLVALYSTTNVDEMTEPEKTELQALQALWYGKECCNHQKQQDKDETKTTKELYASMFDSLIVQQRWSIVDLLQAFPTLQTKLLSSIDTVFAVLPALVPRYYSVSSSPLTNNNKTEDCRTLTVAFAVVDYQTPILLESAKTTAPTIPTPPEGQAGFGRSRRIHGLATTYLEGLASPLLVQDKNDSNIINGPPQVRIFPKPSLDFGLPKALLDRLTTKTTTQTSPPLVLVGPGTGIAPFVGFLRHLQALVPAQTASQLLPPIHVFFGCRHANHDYLYRDELAQFVQDGYIAKLYTAFSRDLDDKDGKRIKYVQDMMQEESTKSVLQDLLRDQQGYLYVCGDGNQMAKDVQSVLATKVLVNDDNDNGWEYLNLMKQEGRFLLDIWT